MVNNFFILLKIQVIHIDGYIQIFNYNNCKCILNCPFKSKNNYSWISLPKTKHEIEKNAIIQYLINSMLIMLDSWDMFEVYD